MTPQTFHDLAMSHAGATFDVKFRGKHVFSVGGRMFASIDRPDDDDPGYRFKASDIAYRVLIETGLARPAPYLARASWVQVLGPDALPDEDVAAYIAQAYALVSGTRRASKAAR